MFRAAECPVSSSGLRQLIEAGDVARAARLLMRPYALEGDVVPGHGVGAKKTVPTLNLATACEVAAQAWRLHHAHHGSGRGRNWASVTNVGYRPTFGGDDRLSIETFLLRRSKGETPRPIRVEFLRRLRDERKFESPEALKAQILHDVRARPVLFPAGRHKLEAATSS